MKTTGGFLFGVLFSALFVYAVGPNDSESVSEGYYAANNLQFLLFAGSIALMIAIASLGDAVREPFTRKETKR
jgi:CDP-diglyceride synthetase